MYMCVRLNGKVFLSLSSFIEAAEIRKSSVVSRIDLEEFWPEGW